MVSPRALAVLRLITRLNLDISSTGSSATSGATGGATGPRQADYKDVFLYRSALNGDEVSALHQGKMLKGSLEIYSPLTDADFKADGTVENRAQSLTALKVGSDRIVHVDETTSTR